MTCGMSVGAIAVDDRPSWRRLVPAECDSLYDSEADKMHCTSGADCTVDCSASSCKDKTIICAAGQACDVQCGTSSSGCSNTNVCGVEATDVTFATGSGTNVNTFPQIVCGSGACTVVCTGHRHNVCNALVVEGGSAQALTVVVQDDGDSRSGIGNYAKIKCPSGACKVLCGTEDDLHSSTNGLCSGMQIDAATGLLISRKSGKPPRSGAYHL